MRHDSSFADLRLNQQQGEEANESFWPSFTDIMTVVVMIFLIAMVVLLMRNMELIAQLRTTMEAERSSAELARTTTEEKATIALRLIKAENELSNLRLQMMYMEKTNDKQSSTIQTQQDKISTLSNDRKRLAAQTATLSRERNDLLIDIQNNSRQLTRLQATLDSRQLELDTRQTELETTIQQLTQAQSELQNTQINLQQKSTELEASRIALENSGNTLSDLESEHSALQVKYDKLVRPARSAQGKYIVEVIYTREGDHFNIQMKETNKDNTFYSVTRQQLDKQLTQLLTDKKDSLYIRVIIPKNSGLSYSEAWKFTSDLHKNYDYYFRDKE